MSHSVSNSATNQSGSSASSKGMRPGGEMVPQLISGASGGTRELWVEVPSEDGGAAAWCYSDRRSYRSGDAVSLHISSTESRLRIRIFRDGEVWSQVHEVEIETVFHPVPEHVYEVGCDWPVTAVYTIPEDLTPGAYVVELSATAAGSRALGHHLFVVKPTRRRPGAIALVLSTSTWSAYNDWGGASHYYGVRAGAVRGRSPILSAQRPWARGQVWLPDGAPRVVNQVRPRQPQMARYDSIEWANLHGFSKYYASAGWASYERHFVRWAEQAGYLVDLYVQEDLHASAGLLDGYQCASFIGHDEYWTREMRASVDAFVDNGGRVMRLAGNFMWQIRLEDEGRRQVAYKYEARELDPLAATDPSHMTGAWEDPLVGNPGATSFGVNALRGMYAAWGAMAPRAARGFTVFRPEHWAFAGTGLGYADMLGDECSVFGFEVDGLEYTFRDGLPYPTHEDGAPATVEILAMNWATAAEDGLPAHQDSHMLGDADARYMAEVSGETGEEAVARRSRTSGMVVAFSRGRGEVFTAASCEWVNGLRGRDFYVEAVTRNVLDRFLAD